jgi:hypothetical protein
MITPNGSAPFCSALRAGIDHGSLIRRAGGPVSPVEKNPLA